MKKRLYILLLTSVCMSCRSPQPSVKTDTEIKGTENKHGVKSSNDSLSLLVLQEARKTYEKVNSLTYDFTQVRTDYSAPDSSGKQHPTSTTETKGKVNSSTTEKATTEDKLSLQMTKVRSSLDSLKSSVNYLVKQSQVVAPDPVTVEKNLSWWQTLFVWTGGIAWVSLLVILVVWVSKRTNWLSRLLSLLKKM